MVAHTEDVFDRVIGGVRRAPASDEIGGGSLRGLSFRLRWLTPTASEGDLTLSLGGDQVWTVAPQTLTTLEWADFLEGLSRAWLHLCLEESYPRGVTPETPSATERALLERVFSETAVRAEFQAFRKHHDLSTWLTQSYSFPQMWIIREGNFMLLEGGNRVLRWAYSDVTRTLEHLGNAITERLSVTSDASTSNALRSWRRREEASDSLLENISLGIGPDRLRYLRSALPVRTRDQIFRGMDEVRAAARMLASYSNDEVILQVATLINAQLHRETVELARSSLSAAGELSKVSRELPRMQGRHIARWLRGTLGKTTLGTRLDPERLLEAWNVAIVPFTTVVQIEAISFWGPSHGPAILLNSAGRRSRKMKEARFGISGGARFTLAHELCHLLLDTEGSLPVAEVLGGGVPSAPEERANAFAAELLLPEHDAGIFYTRSSSADDALRSLTRTYGVTKTLAAWQILKRFGEGSPSLKQGDFDALYQITRSRRPSTM